MTTVTIEGRRVGRMAVITAMAAVAAIGVGGERSAGAGEGGGGAAAASAESVPSVIVPLAPARILDTRTGVGAPAGAVAPQSTLTLQVTGVGGVPADAIGVVLNLTATVADAAGYVTAYPAGQEPPNASVINYSAGEDVANMVTAQIGAGGALAIFNDQANVHLVADVAGYLIPGGGAQGPQGPAGPQGAPGPGAMQIDATLPTGTDALVATVGGIEITGICGLASNELQIATASGLFNLRLGGTWTDDDETVVDDVDDDNVVAHADDGPVHFSGLVEDPAIGAAYQLELHASLGGLCRVWGSAIPLS